MKSLYSYVASVTHRAVALFHRADPQAMTEPQKPLEPPKDSGKTPLAHS
jgi:hypothetical protein